MNKKLQLGMSLAGFLKNNGEDCDEDLTPLWKRMRDASKATALSRKLKVLKDEDEHLVVETKSYDDIRAIIDSYESEFCIGQCTTIEVPDDDEIESLQESTELYSIHNSPRSLEGAAGQMSIYIVY